MISNSAQSHIGNAKTVCSNMRSSFTSEKKIQRPSDDPTVAVRALKYRSTVSQITQYVEKNVKDAMSWMDTTESALKNINSVLVDMKGYLNQGANDYLAQDERNSVLSVLKQCIFYFLRMRQTPIIPADMCLPVTGQTLLCCSVKLPKISLMTLRKILNIQISVR